MTQTHLKIDPENLKYKYKYINKYESREIKLAASSRPHCQWTGGQGDSNMDKTDKYGFVL